MGTARVTASTISGNRVQDGTGGGIDLINGATKLVLTNSTIANNKSTFGGGGINASDVAVVLRNATIARNQGDADATGNNRGGGIQLTSGADVQVRNTIIALNTAFPGDTETPDCAIFGGATITSLGRNLFSNQPAGTFGCGGSFSFPPNILQPNPHLGKLANNGGPTKTIALLRRSKAINHAGPGAPPRDQRGVKRDNHPDIGAFER
jgi:Right handed beta helix region